MYRPNVVNISDGFQKASSNNLPLLQDMTLYEFMMNDTRHVVAENRAGKTTRATREIYGESAIGYVQIKRLDHQCIVSARVAPEHRVTSTPYRVLVTINETTEKIISAECQDCAASLGGCKHAIALLFWLHRRSEEPSPTEVLCYWKKSKLSNVGSLDKYLTVKDS